MAARKGERKGGRGGKEEQKHAEVLLISEYC